MANHEPPCSQLNLELEREFTPTRFAEIGRPYEIFHDRAGRYVAICSAIPSLAWAGRSYREDQTVLHRVSLYDGELKKRLAVLNLREGWEINDVAFHPTEPKIAVGTGGYDGGWNFFGELLLWHWTTDSVQSLLAESREVLRCRFEEASGITIVLHPRDEEEYWGVDAEYEEAKAWDIHLVATIPESPRPPRNEEGLDPRLADLRPSDPARSGFTYLPKKFFELPEEGRTFLEQHGFQERAYIHDLLWIDDETFAAVHQHCQMEKWDHSGARLSILRGEGHGVELLKTREGNCLVNVLVPGWRKRMPDQSMLMVETEGALQTIAAFEHACSITTDRFGNILARDVEYRPDHSQLDRLMRMDGTSIFETNLGHYDSFNHPVRLRGEGLYFLRGTPPSSHQNKKLCSLEIDGQVRELFAWDRADTHTMACVAEFVPPHDVVRGCEIFDGTPVRASMIERLDLETGTSKWQIPTKGSLTSLAVLPKCNAVAYALANGVFGLVDLDSGEHRFRSQFSADGVPSIITALAARDDRLLVGTIDGSILLYRVQKIG